MKTLPVNFEFAKAVGQSSLLRIDWKDWKKETPKHGQEIYVVVKGKCENNRVESAYYFDFSPKWKVVRFNDHPLGQIDLNTPEAKNLIAWGNLKAIVRLGKECSICKRIDCIC